MLVLFKIRVVHHRFIGTCSCLAWEFDARVETRIDSGFRSVTHDDAEFPSTDIYLIAFHAHLNVLIIVAEVRDGCPRAKIDISAENGIACCVE